MSDPTTTTTAADGRRRTPLLVALVLLVVAAFGGDGNAYARFFFYQKIAPSIKTILTDTDGPFGEIFRQYTGAPTGGPSSPAPVAKDGDAPGATSSTAAENRTLNGGQR